jgi:hypothetical protein
MQRGYTVAQERCRLWDEVVNGAELRFETEFDAITPSIVRRAIDYGLLRGFVASNRRSSICLSSRETEQVVYGYSHTITVESGCYVWTPDFGGGLHLKIRSAATSCGQLLATITELTVGQLTDALASSFIVAGLKLGWRPHDAGLDCFWLDRRLCEQIAGVAASPQPASGTETWANNGAAGQREGRLLSYQ